MTKRAIPAPWVVMMDAAKLLIQNKKAQIFINNIESFGPMIDTPFLRAGIEIRASIKFGHNFDVECLFNDADFDINTPCDIDEVAGIKDLPEDARLTGRFMYILWNMYQLVTNKKMCTPGDITDDYIFSKTRTI